MRALSRRSSPAVAHRDGTEVEVFAEVDHSKRTVRIFHMLEARPKVIQQIEQTVNERKQ